MRLLYPCDPFDTRRPDEEYREEFDAMLGAGIACSLFSLEDFQGGRFAPRPAFVRGDQVVYRGWMLRIDDYARLAESVGDAGATAFVTASQYQRCHHLPGWYQACRVWTPETVFFTQDSGFRTGLAHLNWPAYFVKDHVVKTAADGQRPLLPAHSRP